METKNDTILCTV